MFGRCGAPRSQPCLGDAGSLGPEIHYLVRHTEHRKSFEDPLQKNGPSSSPFHDPQEPRKERNDTKRGRRVRKTITTMAVQTRHPDNDTRTSNHQTNQDRRTKTRTHNSNNTPTTNGEELKPNNAHPSQNLGVRRVRLKLQHGMV